MGWTAVQNDWADSFKTAILQEYVDAINERMAVLGETSLDDLADGQDAASAPYLWAAWQGKLGANAPSFLTQGDFDDQAGFTFFTLETWFTAAGLPSGFRRIPTSKTCLVTGVYDADAGTTTITAAGGTPFAAEHVGCKLSVLSPAWRGDYAIAGFTSSTVITITGQCPCVSRRFSVMPADWTDYDDPAFEYGTAQEGDVIGPWLLADLQAAINVLLYTLILSYDWFFSEGEENLREGEGEGATRAAAIAAAQADYGLHTFQETGPPEVYATVGVDGALWRAVYWRRRAWFGWTKPAADINCDADYYAMGWDPYDGTARWMRNGDWSVAFPYYNAGRLCPWLKEAGLSGAGAKESSIEFGVDVCPTWHATVDDTWYGYDYVMGWVLCKWNVAGGFVYVA